MWTFGVMVKCKQESFTEAKVKGLASPALDTLAWDSVKHVLSGEVLSVTLSYSGSTLMKVLMSVLL